ncbi:sulfoxide reductase heme-binding subunit YedZ [Pseudooceanicola antarcticus]|uniref:Protein-methionine-sulfoxide reductase heme-binding subunit MsrQ n=1 Tax=Pseudooceanicola antarcticus TaxID=1247613 RepID=A0A285HKL6_9RHOB|nr:protein-methionine-sulfoxide reductase heme-binding subunit MsrQ [Pseudooceanicola antarcticus]PJE28008.1 protein-methionine-sulfoxide reductase heme-binding subunit MsrQ [Pseudooceanicola antarcticus]SNY35326.1 sulfoxide reductase heme-binding subunit YedZ [Pseudooceanicola antarcticus]
MSVIALPTQVQRSIADPVNRVLRKLPAWPLYILGALPPAWLYWAALNDRLGVDPVKEMEHQMGLWGLWLIIATLTVTPLRTVTGISLLKFRRALGLLTFFYITLHMLVWMYYDVQFLSQVWADIVKRPYITIGMAGLLLMVPLALTSNTWSIRKLGRRWRQLHKLVYAVAILGALHFVILVKGFQLEPILYMAAILVLLALRFPILAKKRR